MDNLTRRLTTSRLTHYEDIDAEKVKDCFDVYIKIKSITYGIDGNELMVFVINAILSYYEWAYGHYNKRELSEKINSIRLDLEALTDKDSINKDYVKVFTALGEIFPLLQHESYH